LDFFSLQLVFCYWWRSDNTVSLHSCLYQQNSLGWTNTCQNGPCSKYFPPHLIWVEKFAHNMTQGYPPGLTFIQKIWNKQFIP
jgi:hypothetical protein